MEIQKDDREFLLRMMPFYEKLWMGGTIHITREEKFRLQEIIRKYWDKTYVTNLTCSNADCVSDLLKMAYNNFKPILQKEQAEQLAESLKEPADSPLPNGAPKPKANVKKRQDQGN